jgi:hypothetical protein
LVLIAIRSRPIRKPKRSPTRKRDESIWAASESGTVRSIAGKELKDALDDLCDSLQHMGTGICYVVHAWWVPPHPVDYCRGTTSDQSHSGTENLVAVSA